MLVKLILQSKIQISRLLIVFCFTIISSEYVFAHEPLFYLENYSSVDLKKFENYPTVCFQDRFLLQADLNELLIAYSDSGNVEYVKFLLNQGANPNATSEYGVTPLMYATQAGSYEVVELLLENKADPNMLPVDGNSALHAAVRTYNDSIAELLIKYDADVNVKNISGLTPLHYACWYGLPYLTDILLYYGAIVNSKDIYGYTPLLLSVYSGANLCSKILLEQNANPDMCNNEGISPLMVAAQYNDTALLNLLLDYKADINLLDKKGFNSLSYAITNDSKDFVRLLVEYGAAEKNIQKSYYQVAAESDFKSMKLLLDSLGLKSKLSPSISNVFIDFGTIFSNHEFLTGINVGLFEQVSKLSVSLGYWYRPVPIATLRYRPQGIFQYKEKRQIIDFKIDKFINLKYFNSGCTAGVYFGGNIDLVFRDFKGTLADPKTSVYPGLNAGLFYGGRRAKITMGWEYTGLRTPDVTPHRFGVHLYYNFFVTKSRISNTVIQHVD
ncbi:MAG: ankyrin repeat domain-containing protein [Bacteroidales bacterium]